MKLMRLSIAAVSFSLLIVLPRPMAADDRALLYQQRAAPSNVLVVVSNTESMADCVPGSALPNGLTCPASGYAYGAPLAPFGMGDGPNSKMGVAKGAIAGIIQSHPTDFNWGLSSFSVSRENLQNLPSKRYVFQAMDDSFDSSSWAYQPAGTWINFGVSVGSPTIIQNGSGSSAIYYEAVPIGGVSSGYSPSTMMGAESWVLSISGDANHQPYRFGTGTAGTYRTIVYNPGGNGLVGKQEVVVTLVATSSTTNDPRQILKCSSVCDPTSALFDGQTFTVRKDLVQCSGSTPCDPTSIGPTSSSLVRYIVPPSFCTESVDGSCAYPMVFAFGPQAGQEIGWTNYSESNTSSNQSGWITQSNNNPQPMVMIPHAYTPWTSYAGATPVSGSLKYTQNSNPCIMRALRPSAALLTNGSGPSETDEFPMFAPTSTTTDSSGNLATAQCDEMVDGLFQTGQFPNSSASQEVIPPIMPRLGSGNGAPLVKLLTNAYQYYNGGNSGCSTAGGGVDGFCGGSRPDDPFRSCRQSAIILITDSFNVPSPGFKYGSSTDPTGQLASIKVPVFVIGFALASGSAGANDCTLKSGASGNTGQCIADYTGATLYNGQQVVRQGYFLANDATSLAAALNSILNLLSTATRLFATAAIPSVTAQSEGIAYLSLFNPRNNRSIWQGHLRAYILNSSGTVNTTAAGNLDNTQYVYGSGSVPPSGSLIWDAGGTGNDTPTGIYGNLDGIRKVTPTNILLSNPGAAGTWSDSLHDQATGSSIGRDVLFGLRPGDAGCGSTTLFCLAEVPVGSGGTSPGPGISEPSGGWTAPAPPSTLPAWWTAVRDDAWYANVPASVPEGNRDQALQNAFSFARGNRDPVVEALKLSSKFTSSTPTCASLATDGDSPCYYGDVLGDIFHSNPIIFGAPSNFIYEFAQDPAQASPGLYTDRGHSYNAFVSSYAHRRRVLYVGGNDGLLHALDAGVFNGDRSTYTDPTTGNAICPLCNKYDLGSGREIFALAPRAGLRKLYQYAHTIQQDWSVDGPTFGGDVYIDESRVGQTAEGVKASGAGGDIAGTSPNWRTVLVGSEREGGGGIYCLDVTDPDKAAHMASTDSGGHIGVPECLVGDFDPSSGSTPTGCNAPYPRLLWDFNDVAVPSAFTGTPAELSTSAEATTRDLGYTWSEPVIARIKAHDTASNSDRDFFVAVFGGGYRHSGDDLSDTYAAGNTGNFLYMVDIETGQVIYKRNIGLWNSGASASTTAGNLGAGVPGQPAVVDLNFDGYADRIYFGDTEGRIWKVDLSVKPDFTAGQISTSFWAPTLMFDEFQSATPPAGYARQPIFERPAVFIVGTTSTGAPLLAVAVGTGDRDNMPVSTDTFPNYFIEVVDNSSTTLYLSNLTQASLMPGTPGPCDAAGSCLQGSGLYVTLPTSSTGAQIVNTEALVFNNVASFSAFLHTTIPGNCNQVGQAYLYEINASTGASVATTKDANGNTVTVPYLAPSGVEVASSPVLYFSSASQGDSGTISHVTTFGWGGNPMGPPSGTLPAAKIKSWKEQ